jgi:hypothetical protein
MVTERVISVIEDAPVKKNEENLRVETTAIEVRAEAMPVTNDQEYEAAAEFGKMIKEQAAKVTEFFSPMKAAAHKAHKDHRDHQDHQVHAIVVLAVVVTVLDQQAHKAHKGNQDQKVQ